MVVYLLFSWSTFFSWLIFLGNIALMAILTLRAYRDAESLDRYDPWLNLNIHEIRKLTQAPRFEMPFFGGLATRFLDDE